MNSNKFPYYIINPKTDKAVWDTQGVINLTAGLTETQREIVLMAAWTHYAMAGYSEAISQTTMMLKLDRKKLEQAARELGSYRPTMVWWFCQEFTGAKCATEILERLIKSFEEEEAQGITGNSRRFLGQLRDHLKEATLLSAER